MGANNCSYITPLYTVSDFNNQIQNNVVGKKAQRWPCKGSI